MTTFAERVCRKKLKFADADEANTKARKLADHDKKPYGIYKCHICDGYHITTKKEQWT